MIDKVTITVVELVFDTMNNIPAVHAVLFDGGGVRQVESEGQYG